MTKGLIEAADDHQQVAPGDPDDYCRSCAESWPCVTRSLADALEAATRVPVQGEPTGINLMRDLGFDEGDPEVIQARADAAQGEPNDELIEYALDYIENGTMRPERRKALQALAARATVPDAATAGTKREAAVRELQSRYGASNGTHAWIEYQGDPHFIVNQVVAALDGAPEPALDEVIHGTPYVFSPDSLSFQIDGEVADLAQPGDSMLREFGVQEGAYFDDLAALSEKVQSVTIAWLESHGYRRNGAPEPEELEELRKWKLAAEVALTQVRIQDEPALDFIAKVVALDGAPEPEEKP